MDKVVENLIPPEDLQKRAQFMAHDFFSSQPIQGADVYYLRWILHSWSSKCAILILRLVPALKPGTRVILQETLMPESDEVALWKERNLRYFENLLKKCDPAFVLRKAMEPGGSALGLLEFVWKGVK
ncbi:hypothetical protein HBI13_030810 [Parastagonospora nodorum]|nr:hypothetical protein HBI10_211500 [Parastagonospora nodorum]KAH4029657.1 hypothetical protein HBI13_030810 [Parastagonospora nodorum]KAH4076068.1 hypothetical protein HBH50_000200 [Parastagonospora nodorum]KAH4236684.1 hypothetical protein HBI06_045430 [Parastagonospora nodorum]KAH4248175.1 hypothetical protein HBI05_015780 [Parastagonospora nodorum]